MPHVCGDEPVVTLLLPLRVPVCPTYVGMNRHQSWIIFVLIGMPHVCGDEPVSYCLPNTIHVYAPRMWG